jgi:hypothetical protein
MGFTNYWSLIKIVTPVFKIVAILYLWPIFEAGIFIFSGHQPVTEKFSTAEYERNPSKPFRDVRGAHPHIRTDRQTALPKSLFEFRGTEKVKILQNIGVDFFTLTMLYHTAYRRQ